MALCQTYKTMSIHAHELSRKHRRLSAEVWTEGLWFEPHTDQKLVMIDTTCTNRSRWLCFCQVNWYFIYNYRADTSSTSFSFNYLMLCLLQFKPHVSGSDTFKCVQTLQLQYLISGKQQQHKQEYEWNLSKVWDKLQVYSV